MVLPAYVRQAHRIIATIWLLLFILALTFDVVGGPESPLISIPLVVSLVLLVLSGGYMLLRPWVRGGATVSDRWGRLTQWNVPRQVFIRRSHRAISSVWVLLLGVGLALEAVGGPDPTAVIIAVVVLLILLILSGGYLLIRPWVLRFRAR